MNYILNLHLFERIYLLTIVSMKNNSLIDIIRVPFLSKAMIFYTYLIVLIPSIICSLFSLYYFLVNPHLRHALNNHVIILVLSIGLIYEVTIYPWMLYYYYYEGIWKRAKSFCLIWAFIDWVFYVLQTILFAWATIERHILIFHDQWISTEKKRFFIHYLPLVILTLYCLIFYIIVDFFPLCQNSFNNSYMRCAYCCINDYTEFYILETIVHQILPNMIIVIFSIALFVRVIRIKYRLQQTIQWRKHRKMTIQLLSISFLYLIFSFPYTILNFMHLFGFSYALNRNLTDFLDFYSYFLMMLLPFVCTLTLPELSKKMKNILSLR
jgi:hypothetical protein